MQAHVEHELVNRFIQAAKKQRYGVISMVPSDRLPGCTHIYLEHNPALSFRDVESTLAWQKRVDAKGRAYDQAIAEGYKEFIYPLFENPSEDPEPPPDMYAGSWV